MKTVSTTLVSLFIMITAIAQLPNGGFEDWEGNVPVDWSNNNIAPLDIFVVTPSADAHSGSLAARGEVIVNPVFPSQVAPPLLQSIGQFSFAEDPAFCTGWYQFTPVQPTASLVISCTMSDENGLPTGIGILQITEAAGDYTSYSVPIDYSIGGSSPAVSASISFTIADNSELSAAGSVFLVDDVALEGTLGIEDQSVVSEFNSPYPSPFSGSTFIPLELKNRASVQIEVLDLYGRPVRTIANGVMAPGSHLLEWTPEGDVASGVYIIRVSHPEGAMAKRVLLRR